MPKVQLENGNKIHYLQVGEGPDLVMIHGLTGNMAVWHLHIMPQLTDHFRVTTYDLRGHGRSDVPPAGYTCDDMAEDLLHLMDALEIEQADLVGHSFGADIALYFAHSFPDRAKNVVTIEGALPAMIYARDRQDWVGWTYWADVLREAGVDIPKDKETDIGWMLRASLEVPKQWGPLAGLPRNPKPFLKLIDETSMSKDYEKVGTLTLEALEEIQHPVTVMFCEESAFMNTHDMLMERLPNPISVLLPRTEHGHFGPLEQPDIVAAHILEQLGVSKKS